MTFKVGKSTRDRYARLRAAKPGCGCGGHTADAGAFEEGKHPRGEGGRFAAEAAAHRTAQAEHAKLREHHQAEARARGESESTPPKGSHAAAASMHGSGHYYHGRAAEAYEQGKGEEGAAAAKQAQRFGGYAHSASKKLGSGKHQYPSEKTNNFQIESPSSSEVRAKRINSYLKQRWIGPRSRDANFEESKHPRNEGGEFTSGAGGLTAKEHTAAEAHHRKEAENTFKAGKRLASVKHDHAAGHHGTAAIHLENGDVPKAENSRKLAQLSEKEAATAGAPNPHPPASYPRDPDDPDMPAPDVASGMEKHGDAIEAAKTPAEKQAAVKATPTPVLNALVDFNMGVSGAATHPDIPAIKQELAARTKGAPKLAAKPAQKAAFKKAKSGGFSHNYDPAAVNQAISAQNRSGRGRIGGKEAKMIHALLKGRHGG